MCLFVVVDAESSAKGLPALFRMFPTGPICQTAGMVIVDEMRQPLIQPIHDGSNSCNSSFGIGATYIVPISAIQGTVHLLPLTLQPDRLWGYLSNSIDLNVLNLICMWIIQLDD
jgi:hypothetical protein